MTNLNRQKTKLNNLRILKFLLIGVVSLLFLSECSNTKPTGGGTPLQLAWKKKDRDFFIKYLDSLNKVDFDAFIYDIYDVANASNFIYGLLDTDSNWSAMNKDTIHQTQLDIIRVNKLFFKHCSFEIPAQYNDSLKYLQDKYFKYYSHTEMEYDTIEKEIDSVCQYLVNKH